MPNFEVEKYIVENEIESNDMVKIVDFLQEKYGGKSADWSAIHVTLYKDNKSINPFKTFYVQPIYKQ